MFLLEASLFDDRSFYWHRDSVGIRLTDVSGNRMARLRDYTYYDPSIQLSDEMSGN